MIEMVCPSCGRGGQVPPEKIHARLVCRKCHVVFHLDQSGRAVLGEPAVAGAKNAKAGKKGKSGEHQSAFEGLHIPSVDELADLGETLRGYNFLQPKPLAAIAGSLIVLWFLYGFLFGPVESVADRSQYATQLLLRDDIGKLQSMSTDDTKDNVKQWYDAIHPKLEASRKVWGASTPAVQTLVVEEDTRTRRGAVEVFIMKAGGAAAAATPPATPPPPPTSNSKNNAPGPYEPPPGSPVSFHLIWVYSGGHWLLEARQTAALALR
jgi:hypothetical protein